MRAILPFHRLTPPGQSALVWLFGFFAALMGFACLILTPPGQTPDERNHFARIVQISQGGIVGLKRGDQDAGGYLPANLPSEAEFLEDLRFHPDHRVRLDELNGLARRHWGKERKWTSFANTVIYAPITYAPAAAVTAIARVGRATIVQTSYAVRTVNLGVTLLLCCLGLTVACRGRLYLALLASFPMVWALGASCSQDGLLFGLAFLLASCLTRIDQAYRGTKRFWIFIAVGFAFLAVSKPPLLLCTLIPLGLCRSGHRMLTALPVLFSLLMFLIWQNLGLSPTKIQFLSGQGVSDSGQIHWVFSHPFNIPGIALRTLEATWLMRIHEFIGVLGWLDTVMPRWYYWLVYALVPAVFYTGFVRKKNLSLEMQNSYVILITLCCICLSIGAVYFSLYVIWNSVGASIIDGVQGRYFLPIAPFLALVFPAMKGGGLPRGTALSEWTILSAGGLYLFIETIMLTATLASRYW